MTLIMKQDAVDKIQLKGGCFCIAVSVILIVTYNLT